MIIEKCIQGSAEWHRLKLGVISTTGAGDIITPPSRELSDLIHLVAIDNFSAGRITRKDGERLCATGRVNYKPVSLESFNCPKCIEIWGRDSRQGPAVVARIETVKGGELSASRTPYMLKKLAEWALGRDVDEFGGNAWTERGHEYEGDALDFYSLQRDGVTPESVGFIYKDETRLTGCSPDWWCPPDGGVEVKCPSAWVHMGYLLAHGVPRQYKLQTQFSIWCTASKWWDFISYHPDLPAVLVRTYPDPDTQAALDKHIPAFIAEMLEARELLRQRGVVSPLEAGE